MNDNGNQVSKYDRLRGGLEGVAQFSSPSTVVNVEVLTGREETFVVERCRTEHGDYAFIRLMDENGVTRMALPPKVLNALTRQYDSLTTSGRVRRGKAAWKAKKEKDPNYQPAFLKVKHARKRKKQAG
jgi:hypothetical protein